MNHAPRKGPYLSGQSPQYEQQLQVLNPATEEVVATVPAATPADVDAAVSYYGVGLENRVGEAGDIEKPLMLHIAEKDSFSSDAARQVVVSALKDHPNVTIHIYEGRDHAFARPGGEHWHAEDAALANQRTADFFKANLS